MKLLTTLLAISLGLLVCSTAAADPQDLRNPDQVAPMPMLHQDLRNPDRIAPMPVPHQDLRNPDRIATAVPAELQDAATAASRAATASMPADATPASDGGLSTLLIVLISIGGAVALAGAGYATVRLAHAHGRPAI
jgi:hypothetical protein